MPAWKIIDEMGYRGYQIGGARISDKHSNFIVNENDQATAHDVMALIEMIKTQAKKEFDIDLITEVEQLNWKK
jgi:UDP-N-acetylmuramate dehydrogenase